MAGVGVGVGVGVACASGVGGVEEDDERRLGTSNRKEGRESSGREWEEIGLRRVCRNDNSLALIVFR